MWLTCKTGRPSFFEGVKTMAGEPILEILMDGIMFSTKDLQVHIVHAPRAKVASYLPPLICRHIRWRDQQAGAQVAEQDVEQFQRTGFRAKKRQALHDCLRDLHHVLKNAATNGEGLMKFKAPSVLEPIPAGGKRVWSEEQQRWYRTKDTPTPGVEDNLVPELPDPMFNMYQVNVLIAGCDQKQCQRASFECLAACDNLVARRNDGYHRSWRDFVWATENAEGGFHHTCAQMSHAYNVNYHAMGVHMAKKKELQDEWKKMLPSPGADVASLSL